MKKKVVVIAFDDGPHHRHQLSHYRNNTLSNQDDGNSFTTDLIGVVCRGTQLLHVSRSKIKIDGNDSTSQLIHQIQINPFLHEIRLIFIDSPTLAGFNPPNPFQIYETTQIPLVLLPDRPPKSNIAAIFAKTFPHRTTEIKFLQNLPPLEEVIVKINQDPNINGKIYFHSIGIEKQELFPVLQQLSEYSAIPEPLRLAHIIASGSLIFKK